MPLPRALMRHIPAAVRARGDAYFDAGAVVHTEAEPARVQAIVRGTRPYRVWIAREGPELTASCECEYFRDRQDVCKHIWALLREAEHSGFLGLDRDAGEQLRLRAASATAPSSTRTWQRFISNVSLELARAERDAPPPRFRDAEIVYAIDRDASLAGTAIALELLSRTRTLQGRWGRPKRIGVSMRDVPHLPDPIDREILPLLLGATDIYYAGYLAAQGRGSFRLGEPLLDRVLPTIVQSGRAVLRVRRQPGEELIPLTWDDGPPWVFRLEVGHPSRDADISIDGALVRGSERLLIREPTMILPAGYLVHAGRVHAASATARNRPARDPAGRDGTARRRARAIRGRSLRSARRTPVRHRGDAAAAHRADQGRRGRARVVAPRVARVRVRRDGRRVRSGRDAVRP